MRYLSASRSIAGRFGQGILKYHSAARAIPVGVLQYDRVGVPTLAQADLLVGAHQRQPRISLLINARRPDRIEGADYRFPSRDRSIDSLDLPISFVVDVAGVPYTRARPPAPVPCRRSLVARS